jgi:hypothetical protein
MPVLGLVPSRTLAPSRKRFGAVRLPANNIRPYTLKTWQPPVPEPLPPAPLLSPLKLLAVGLLVALQQIWGLLNRNRKDKQEAATGAEFIGQGDYQWGSREIYKQSGVTKCFPAPPVSSPSETNNPSNGTTNQAHGLRIQHFKQIRRRVCGTPDPSFPVAARPWRTIEWRKADGTWTVQQSDTYFSGEDAGLGEQFEFSTEGVFAYVRRNGVDLPIPTTGELDNPDTYPEELKPLPPLITPVQPAPELPEPLPETDTDPEVVPVQPGQVPPVTTPTLPPTYRPIQIPGTTGTVNGEIVPTTPKPVPVTPPGSHYPVPNGPPVTGISVRPDIAAVAQEVGRIEQKLERLMSPAPDTLGEKWGLILRAVEALMASASGGTYTLTEPCDPDGDGVFVKREVPYLGAFDQLGVLSNKLDALAELQQAAKDLRQPTCNPPLPKRTGEPVTVTFRSDGVSPVSGNSLVKMFKYFDQTGKSLEDHSAHWKGFTWQAGDVVVSAYGTALGKPQVWAASEAEGRRVIEHAASVAGVDLTDASWKAVTPANPRYGMPGLMRVKDYGGYLWVTKRPDPSGPPQLAAP